MTSYQCSICPNCHDDHNHTESECISRRNKAEREAEARHQAALAATQKVDHLRDATK